MKTLLICFWLIFYTSTRLLCQDISVGMSTGFASYAMTELKEFNEDIFPDFDAGQVSEFPPYLYFQPGIKFTWVRFSLGLEYSYQSTGSRISAKDYSGEYRFDLMVHSSNAGFHAGWELIRHRKGQWILGTRAGMAFSILEMKYFLELNNAIIHENHQNLKALHYYFEPCLEYDYSILPRLSLGLQGGYYLDIGDKPFKKEYPLTNKKGDGVGPDWKGLRLGIVLNFGLSGSLMKEPL